MGINKKRDKKNFQKQKRLLKQRKQQKAEGVVDFLDQREFKKYTDIKPRTKQLMRKFRSGRSSGWRAVDSESPQRPSAAQRKSTSQRAAKEAEPRLSADPDVSASDNSDDNGELGFGHELDQLIYDKEYEFSKHSKSSTRSGFTLKATTMPAQTRPLATTAEMATIETNSKTAASSGRVKRRPNPSRRYRTRSWRSLATTSRAASARS